MKTKTPGQLRGPAPGRRLHEREAIVEHFPLGETSIVHGGDRIAVLLDISHVQMPAFCQFRFAAMSGQEEMQYEVFELVGAEKLWIWGERIQINVLGIEEAQGDTLCPAKPGRNPAVK